MGMHVYRQGDVAFIPREDLPKSVADIDNMVGRDKKTKAKVLKTRVVRKGENGGIHAGTAQPPFSISRISSPWRSAGTFQPLRC